MDTMSLISGAVRSMQQPEDSRHRAWTALSATVILTMAGLMLCFHSELAALWVLWTTDPLRSIGMAVPIVSAGLLIRCWRLEDWTQGGTWWGLVLVGVSLFLGILVGIAPMHVRFNAAFGSLNLIPRGLSLAGFVSGMVLLFGGARAWRKAWFPLLLLLFLNPVPGWFNGAVDLPMQFFAAHAARGFAGLLDVPVSQGTLKMMFTPHLGMFIAPGCDGLRGAVAMGYLALVIGYLYRLDWMRWAIYVVSAILLAYVFNLVRLCGVVVYYWFAMRFPAIAHHATLADYLIGGVLFFCAALFLFSIPRLWRRPCTAS